jgi:endonuclease/exonuclease/phosphatase family metal-dependent hydrolase
VVGFEEVDTLPAFDELMSKLPGWRALVGATGFETRVTLAYRTDRLSVVDAQNLFLGDPDRFPRPPLAVTFEVKGRVGASRFTVVVVHLKAMIDAESRDRRRRAILALDAWMTAHREAGHPVMVIGDWNDDIDAPADVNVFAPMLDRPDAYAPLTLAPAQRDEYSYIPFRRLIDHIVVTADAAKRFPALAVDAVKLDATIPNYAEVVSDHRPVRADLVPIIPR